MEFNTTEGVRAITAYYVNEMLSKGWYINSKSVDSPTANSVAASRQYRTLGMNVSVNPEIGMQVVHLVLCVD